MKCNEDRSNDKGDEIPKGASIAHHYLQKEKLVYVSFDIETAGESCGIVQLSAQIFWMVHRNGVTESEIEEDTSASGKVINQLANVLFPVLSIFNIAYTIG